MKAALKRLWALALVTVMGAVLTIASPAAAQTAEPQVLYVAPRVIVNPFQPDTAYVIGVYRCSGGDPIHLWVSAKQGGPNPSAEGSGATSTSWYDTNISGGVPVVCDGTYRVAYVPIGKYPNKARLTSGPVWIQFCLVDFENDIVASKQFYGTVAGVF
jgi:hypothetical protein